METSENRVKYYPWIMLVCAVSMNFLFPGMIYNTLNVYTPSILKVFPEFSRSAFVFSITLGNLVTAAGNLVYEPMHRKLGIRGLIATGTVSMLIGVLIFSSASTLPIFYLGAAFMGYSIATCASTSTVLIVNNWFAKRTGTLVSVAMSGTGIGCAVFSPIVSYWIMTYDWRVSLRITAVIFVIAAAILLFVFRNSPKDIGGKRLWESEEEIGAKKEAVETTGGSIYQNPNYRILMVLSFLIGLLLFSVMTNMPVLASDMGMSTMHVGYISSIAYGTNVLLQLPVGICCDKVGSVKILYVTFTLFAVALVVLNVPGISFLVLAVVAAYTGYGKVVLNNVTPFMVQETVPAKDKEKMVSTCVGLM
ncbi:MAG: MFS transporter, partial [Lachnospiraceae bacterium]|nr:MFS transporter [Lachnospiraceae bacterium]